MSSSVTAKLLYISLCVVFIVNIISLTNSINNNNQHIFVSSIPLYHNNQQYRQQQHQQILKQHQHKEQGFECPVCKWIVGTIEIYVRDNDTTTEIISEVQSQCQSLGDHQWIQLCVQLIQQDGEELVNYVRVNNDDPLEACSLMGLCSGGTSSSSSASTSTSGSNSGAISGTSGGTGSSGGDSGGSGDSGNSNAGGRGTYSGGSGGASYGGNSEGWTGQATGSSGMNFN